MPVVVPADLSLRAGGMAAAAEMGRGVKPGIGCSCSRDAAWRCAAILRARGVLLRHGRGTGRRARLRAAVSPNGHRPRPFFKASGSSAHVYYADPATTPRARI